MVMVCEWFGLKTTRMIFIGLASKPVVTVSSGLASKPAVMVSSGLASKPATPVSGGLASKPATAVFSSLTSKLVATVSPGLASKPVIVFLVKPENQGGGGFPGLGLKTGSFGLSVAPQNRRREVSVGHTSRSSGLLHVEASLARVS
jgi:hypothetical protein